MKNRYYIPYALFQQRSILAKNDFFEKGNQKFHQPYSSPFVSVLHQNKALHNFCKRGQRSIIELKKGPN